MIATSSQLLWYTTRATGVVALVLLTVAVVLGVLTSVRYDTARWPRFALQDLHKRVSLLAMAFIGLHILTTVTDTYAPIGWVSVFVPFTSSYRRLWLGLGTVAFDLLLAVAVSSMLRRRVPAQLWRALHWLTYASWPLALVHGLGSGTDPRLGWMVLLSIGCVSAVLAAVGWRLVSGWPSRRPARLLAGGGSVAVVVATAVFAAAGPLRPGWAARAGTPTSLLGGSGAASSGAAGTQAPGAAPATTAPSSSALPSPPWSATLAGSISEVSQASGLVQLDVTAQTQGQLQGVLSVVLTGRPSSDGGVYMQQGTASFGPPGDPSQFQGPVVELRRSSMLLALSSSGGGTVEVRLDLAVAGNEVTGQLSSVTGSQGAFGDDY